MLINFTENKFSKDTQLCWATWTVCLWDHEIFSLRLFFPAVVLWKLIEMNGKFWWMWFWWMWFSYFPRVIDSTVPQIKIVTAVVAAAAFVLLYENVWRLFIYCLYFVNTSWMSASFNFSSFALLKGSRFYYISQLFLLHISECFASKINFNLILMVYGLKPFQVPSSNFSCVFIVLMHDNNASWIFTKQSHT